MKNDIPAYMPVWLSSCLCLAMFLGAEELWRVSQRGFPIALIGSALAAYLSLKYLLRAIGGTFRCLGNRIAERRAAKASTVHGNARFANKKEIEQEGMFEPRRFLLGKAFGRNLFYNGETSLLTIAPPGAGKGICIVLPILLNLLRLAERIGAVIVDPKLEIWAIISRAFEAAGIKVHLVAPFAKEMSVGLGRTVIDSGFNILSYLGKGAGIREEVDLIVSLLISDGLRPNESDLFWKDNGRDVLKFVILYLYWRYKDINLTMVRAMVMAPQSELLEVLYEAQETDVFNGALRELASKLLGAYERASQQFEGYLGTAQRAVRLFERGTSIGESASFGEIDWEAIKRGEAILIFNIPPERIQSYGSVLEMYLSYAMERIGRERTNKPVLFMIDEFANAVQRLPNIHRVMGLYRSQGVIVHAIVQSLNQIERIYGREGLHEFLDMCDVVNVFGVRDPITLKMLSEWMGNETVRQFSQNINPEQASGRFSHGYNASDVGRPLMSPNEIKTLPADEQLVFCKNLPVIKAKKVSYLDSEDLRKLADPNPYYRRDET